MNDDRYFGVWFASAAFLTVVWFVFLTWAGYQLLTWVTAQ